MQSRTASLPQPGTTGRSHLTPRPPYTSQRNPSAIPDQNDMRSRLRMLSTHIDHVGVSDGQSVAPLGLVQVDGEGGRLGLDRANHIPRLHARVGTGVRVRVSASYPLILPLAAGHSVPERCHYTIRWYESCVTQAFPLGSSRDGMPVDPRSPLSTPKNLYPILYTIGGICPSLPAA
jgi:hypothetical protein